MTPPQAGGESVETQLGIINTKLDVLIEQRSDHEVRIRSLEQFKWLIAGGALTGGGAAGGLVAKLISG